MIRKASSDAAFSCSIDELEHDCIPNDRTIIGMTAKAAADEMMDWIRMIGKFPEKYDFSFNLRTWLPLFFPFNTVNIKT